MSKPSEKDLALFSYIELGDASECAELIAEGANVNAKYDRGQVTETPLYNAVFHGESKIIEMLIAAGADIHFKAVGMQSRSLLHTAAIGGHVEACKVLLAAGLDKDGVEDSGLTPLHLAAVRGEEGVCRYLLEQGANGGVFDHGGATPLGEAATAGHLGICRLLVEAGVSPSLAPADADEMYLTPMQHAVLADQFEAVKFFVEECGEDLEQIVRQGCTLEQLAFDSPAVRGYLLSRRTNELVQDSFDDERSPARPRSSGMSPL